MGCCTGFARFLLITFNLIFWLSGAALLGVGIWIVVDPDIEEYQKVIEDASADNGEFLKNAAYILIGFGAFVFLVGFCGCCGAIRKSKCLLGFYIFFLVLVFAGELAAIIYVAINKDNVESDLDNGLKTSIQTHYKSSLGTAWDALQKELECCGGTGPSDYDNSTFNEGNASKEIPESCCRLDDDGNAVDTVKCINKTKPQYYYDKGCKDAIKDWIEDNSVIVIGVGAGLAALQIIVFICAICFCRNMEKED